jgi:hypothetical protein
MQRALHHGGYLLAGRPPLHVRRPFPHGELHPVLHSFGLKGLRNGAPRKFWWNNTRFPEYLIMELEGALDTLRKAGATVVAPVLLVSDPE